jgi:hypothetical protein
LAILLDFQAAVSVTAKDHGVVWFRTQKLRCHVPLAMLQLLHPPGAGGWFQDNCHIILALDLKAYTARPVLEQQLLAPCTVKGWNNNHVAAVNAQQLCHLIL